MARVAPNMKIFLLESFMFNSSNNRNCHTMLINDSFLNYSYVPRAARIPADQNTSPHRAGMNSNPPIRPPRHSCRGSNIVIYPSFLIRCAKNIPP